MERRYAWQRKKKGRVHFLDEHDRTLCQLEKTGAVFPIRGREPPKDKRLCLNCQTIEEERLAGPSLKVLMGEAMV